MPDLHRYWPTLLTEHTDLCGRLLERYDEEGRSYHDTRHLGEVFERIDVLLNSGSRVGVDEDALLLAAWFHDAVYDTDGDNEDRSATLAERELATAEVPPLLVEDVARLVRLTATHRPSGNDRTGQVLCDADLGILAADEARYQEYTAGVRQEYASIADDDFRQGRASVLRNLLDSPSLFTTPFAQEHWEEPARRNVERELTILESSAD